MSIGYWKKKWCWFTVRFNLLIQIEIILLSLHLACCRKWYLQQTIKTACALYSLRNSIVFWSHSLRKNLLPEKPPIRPLTTLLTFLKAFQVSDLLKKRVGEALRNKIKEPIKLWFLAPAIPEKLVATTTSRYYPTRASFKSSRWSRLGTRRY